MPKHDFATDLLDWYDVHARDLAWRVGPGQRAAGQRPDPYRVWLSEIMLQQTTVATVGDCFRRFVARWPTVAALAAAQDGDVMAEWAGLGYYARARNLLKCARIVTGDFGGHFPDRYDALLALPGIGPYSAAAIAAIAHDQPETVVDGNVKRVMARFFALREPLAQALPQLTAHARRLTPALRPGDYAQAIMDLGATVCTPKNPACDICPCCANCRAFALGITADLPQKPARLAKPTRHGIAHVARRTDGAWLLERRPDSGLLGGMLGWPTGIWGDDARAVAPIAGDWDTRNTAVKHTFTHFHLRLTVLTLSVGMDAKPDVGFFVPPQSFQRSDLPTVMRKVYDASLSAFALD